MYEWQDNLSAYTSEERFAVVFDGHSLRGKVFTDSSPVPVATFLPFNPSVFVAANSNAVLRLQ